jgi:hypothetical protein
MTPVSPETKAREYAASKWSGPENGHLKVYTQNDFRAGYQAGYSAALAALLTEDEIWSALKDQCASDPDTAKRLVMVSRADFSAAFARLVQLRTANGEKK